MPNGMPKNSERYFAGECSLAGALGHPPEEDERGLDFLVEFAKQEHPVHADTESVRKAELDGADLHQKVIHYRLLRRRRLWIRSRMREFIESFGCY